MTVDYTDHFHFGIPDFATSPWHADFEALIRHIDQTLYSIAVADNVSTWANSTVYAVGNVAVDTADGTLWVVAIAHTSSAAPTTFAQYRVANPTHWTALTQDSASAISFAPTGNIVAINVQDAIAELDAEKIASTNPILSGTVTIAAGGVLDFAGDITVTRVPNQLNFAGATAGYTFDERVTMAGATLTAALIYGGVTLANAVTGTGNMVLSISPTFTGTVAAAALTTSGLLTAANALTVSSGNVTVSSGNLTLTTGNLSVAGTGAITGNTVIGAASGTNDILSVSKLASAAVSIGWFQSGIGQWSMGMTSGSSALRIAVNNVVGVGTDLLTLTTAGALSLTGSFMASASVASGNIATADLMNVGRVAAGVVSFGWYQGGFTQWSMGMGSSSTVLAIANGGVVGTGTTRWTMGTDGATAITVQSSQAFSVGRQGSVNPAFAVSCAGASNVTGLLVAAGNAAGGLALSVQSTGANEPLTINAKGSGAIAIGNVSSGLIQFPLCGTTAVAPNATILGGSGNSLHVSTSSIQFKKDIEPIGEKYWRKILEEANPIWFRSKIAIDDGGSFYGFIAEEMEKIDRRFVHYTKDKNGRIVPNGVAYTMMTVPLVAGWQDHERRISALESRVTHTKRKGKK